nr:MAG TPA: hypothetical protein [Caudoviricetes sp.]
MVQQNLVPFRVEKEVLPVLLYSRCLTVML